MKFLFVTAIIFFFNYTIDAQPSNSPLVNAVKENDIERVKKLIKDGRDINQEITSWGGRKTNLLNIAITNQNSEIIKFLIDQGVNINWKDGNGVTPIFHAIYTNNIDIVKLIVEGGAKLNVVDYSGTDIYGALESTSNKNIKEYIYLMLE